MIVDDGCGGRSQIVRMGGGRSQSENGPEAYLFYTNCCQLRDILKVDLKEQNDKEATGKERKIG